MLAALSLLVLLTLSIFIVRLGAVALRLTGVPDAVARFQARSAFTGAGFTTSETEQVVNHPVRRRIVGLLMVIGSIGLVGLISTLIVSLVRVDASPGALAQQLLWLGGVIVVLWIFMLNPLSDRIMCGAMARLLRRHTDLAESNYDHLLHVGERYRVCSLAIGEKSTAAGKSLGALDLQSVGLIALGITRADQSYVGIPDNDESVRAGDLLVLYGTGEAHRQFRKRWTQPDEAPTTA